MTDQCGDAWGMILGVSFGLFHDLALGQSLYSVFVVSSTKCYCLVHSRFGYYNLLKPRGINGVACQKRQWMKRNLVRKASGV